MRTLLALARYNGWGNRRMWDVCEAAGPAIATASAEGTVGSIGETLKHLVGVEDAYLAMLEGSSAADAFGSREQYFSRDLAWFRARSAQLGESYLALLAARDDTWAGGPMRVPWFDFPITRRDGALQALTHSAQHRAQVLSVLGARGLTIPDMDYVFMVGEADRAVSS